MSNYKANQLDWLSFAAPDDIHAPHPDLFEFELDNSLAGVDHAQLQLLNLDFSAEPFTYFRSENPVCGPPSTITISSESAYESPSASLYSFPHSPTYSSIESVYSNDLHMNFAKFSVESNESAVIAAPQPVSAANPAALMDDTDADENCFGELPVSPYDSARSGSFEYDSSSSMSSVNGIPPADFYLPSQSRVPSAPQPTPRASSTLTSISIPLPIPRLTLAMSDAQSNGSAGDSGGGDGRRKYQCPSCPRAFARAYNLKTHMATHDPHRLKPFACPHKACGRSFSRKHDLGRHLVSIHHDDPQDKKIGVQSGSRTWCDTCGKGWNSASTACGCAT